MKRKAIRKELMESLTVSVHRMSFKIFGTVMGVLLFFLLALGLMNQVFLRESKENFIFHQLQEAAQAQSLKGESDKGEGSLNSYISHFIIETASDGYQIYADRFIQKTLMVGNRENVLQVIADKIVLDAQAGSLEAEGRQEIDSAVYYYYAQDMGDEIVVYLTSITGEKGINPIYILAFASAVLVALIASNIVARRLVRPIQALEDFAQEVAKHRWQVTAPKSDTVEIQALADALEGMKNTLKETQERERQFLQSGSHNLKTPVMVIKGYAQAIIDGVLDRPAEHAAEIIRIEAENLERRIGQILKLNTYGHTMEVSENGEVIRLDRLMKSLIHRFSVVRPDLQMESSLVEVEVTANSDALRTAFENLFENGMRFAKSRIEVRMQISDCIKIRISNDGPGFNQPDPMVLFERYEKDQAGQFGLGLAIVKQIVEGHGGSVTAGNLEEGVYFDIMLPTEMRVEGQEA